MSYKVEKIEKSMLKLEITVDKDTFEKGLQKAYNKNVGKFNVPGFRKGKAPRAFIEKMYGEGVFFEDAINIVCPEAYENVLAQENIDAVSQPEIDIIDIGKGKDLVFTAKVTIKPEVKLGKYKGVKVEKGSSSVSELEIDNEIEKMREKNARILNSDDKTVENGDIVTIDFEGFIDEVPFNGGKGENYDLTIGSGQFIPGFEDQLIGNKVGDNVDVNVKFPEEYHSKDVAGKDTLFKVKVNAIKVKELPSLDDEFAKDVSEFDSLEELKNSIKDKLEHQKEHELSHEVENSVIKAVSEDAELDIPQVMIDNQIQEMARDFSMRLKYQGLDLSRYLQMTGTSPEDFKNSLHPQAVDQVRARLVLEAVAKEENISASEEDLEKELIKLAQNYEQNIEHFKEHLRPEDIKYIKEGIVFDKTIDFLVENAKITNKKDA